MEPYITFQDAYLGIYTKSYLLQTDHFNVFIDSGLASGSGARLPYLENGRKNVLLLTHGHWDHIGNVELTRRHGGKVYGNAADRRLLTDLDWHWELLFGQFAEDFDLPPARKLTFWDSVEQSDLDEVVSDGDLLVFDHLRFRVIAIPGHSAGSVCFLEETSNTLFTGDGLMRNGFFTGTPQIENFIQYMASMERLKSLSVQVIYTDHTDPIPGNALVKAAQESQDCAQRMLRAVSLYAENAKMVTVGEAAAAIAKAEGKGVGGGTCVSALGALKELYSVPLAQECANKYMFGA